jgi:hypothetical protein
MRKRIILLLTVCLILITVTGCGKKVRTNSTPVTTEKTSVTETELATDTQTEEPREQMGETSTQADADSTEENMSETEEPVSGTEESQQDDTTQHKYLEVLQNKMTFVDTNNNSKPSFLRSIYYGEGVTCTPKQFALVDFDRDSEPEVCVQVNLGVDSEFVVLHYSDGKVYGDSFPYRALQQLGNNGYYLASSGAANTDIMGMSFDGSKVIENKVAYSDVDGGNNPVYFKGNGVQMKEKDWTKLLTGVQNNPPVWHTFDEEDWESYFD